MNYIVFVYGFVLIIAILTGLISIPRTMAAV